MKYKYIEIGTSDYDTLNDYSKNKNISGISIEANPYYFINLKKYEKNKYFNVFITDSKKKSTTLYYLHPDDLKKMGKIPIWFRGLSTSNKNLITKNIIKEKGEKYIKYIKNIEINNINISNLFSKNNINIKKINYVKIDTELADIIIMNMILKYFKNNCNFLVFESFNFNKELLLKVKKKHQKNYLITTATSSDWLLIKKNIVNKFIQFLFDIEKLEYKMDIFNKLKKLFINKKSKLHTFTHTKINNKIIFKNKKLEKYFKKNNKLVTINNININQLENIIDKEINKILIFKIKNLNLKNFKYLKKFINKNYNIYKIKNKEYFVCDKILNKYLICSIMYYLNVYGDRFNLIIDFIIKNTK